MNNKQILDNAPEGATHYDQGEYMKATGYSEWVGYSNSFGWVETEAESEVRSLADIREIESLKQQLATAKADALCKFVSDTTETGQFGWSDCQWLDDWKCEWLEQQAKEQGE